MGAAEAEALNLELITATSTSTLPLDGSADDNQDRDPLLDHKDLQSGTSYAPESESSYWKLVYLLLAALVISALITIPTVFAGGIGNPPPGGSSSTSRPGQWVPSQTPPVLPRYPAPLLPRRENVMRVDDFGAVGDGLTMNTEAFEKAITAAKEKSGGGGTTLVVPAGKWLTGPFYLTSNFTLQLNDGATILASQTFEHYASILPFASYYDVGDPTRLQYQSFISGTDLVDVVITGTGTIDGQGNPWWEARRANASFWSAPRLVEFVNCTDIIISGVTLQNSQMWTLHPIFCARLHIHGILILAPNNSRNTDGINPDSSVDVLIENCRINNGDDSISIKSGLNNFGLAVNRPSRNITIRSLTLGRTTRSVTGTRASLSRRPPWRTLPSPSSLLSTAGTASSSPASQPSHSSSTSETSPSNAPKSPGRARTSKVNCQTSAPRPPPAAPMAVDQTSKARDTPTTATTSGICTWGGKR